MSTKTKYIRKGPRISVIATGEIIFDGTNVPLEHTHVHGERRGINAAKRTSRELQGAALGHGSLVAVDK